MNYTIKTSTYYEALLALANKYNKIVLKHEEVSKEDIEKALEIAKDLKEENEIMHSAFIARENRRYGDTLSTVRRLESKAESMLKEITESKEDFESMDKEELIKLVKKMKEEKSKKEEEGKVLVLRAPEESKKNEEDSEK